MHLAIPKRIFLHYQITCDTASDIIASGDYVLTWQEFTHRRLREMMASELEKCTKQTYDDEMFVLHNPTHKLDDHCLPTGRAFKLDFTCQGTPWHLEILLTGSDEPDQY